MTNVNYTEEFTSNSSLVDDVYYNDNDRTLTVDLNDEIYRYNNVPKYVFEDFRKASSKGRFYATEVKRKFGPGQHLGEYDDVEFERVTGLSTGVGTPKGLTYAPDAVISGTIQSSGNYVTLSTSTNQPAPAERKHVVTFEVDGKTKQHTLKAASVDEAVNVVQEIGDMLDLTFVVKEVTVYFE